MGPFNSPGMAGGTAPRLSSRLTGSGPLGLWDAKPLGIFPSFREQVAAQEERVDEFNRRSSNGSGANGGQATFTGINSGQQANGYLAANRTRPGSLAAAMGQLR